MFISGYFSKVNFRYKYDTILDIIVRCYPFFRCKVLSKVNLPSNNLKNFNSRITFIPLKLTVKFRSTMIDKSSFTYNSKSNV
ncbi:hypothetical protein LCGC14_1326590 [marine sediment metagenome]|uniref:Uncharacterized protein n=1 Tax=marine sediment metagenome TaxID=412755 RepID=A0A0F9KIJ5_9ZZZZ